MHLLSVLFRRKVLLAVALLDLLILAAAWRWHREVAPRRVVDRVGIISVAEQRNYNLPSPPLCGSRLMQQIGQCPQAMDAA